jgi:hypothetical protein
MISVVCYMWQGPRVFLPEYANALARMVKHYLTIPHRFICVTDRLDGFSSDVEVMPMPDEAARVARFGSPMGAKFPASYRRLWSFSSEAKVLGERVLLLDIDCLVVGDLGRLFRQEDDFVGWRVRSPRGLPPRFGGGTWLLRTGTCTQVWDEFIANPKGAISAAHMAGYMGSDQAWISYTLKDRPAFREPSGIYCAQDCRRFAKPPKPPKLLRVRGRWPKRPIGKGPLAIPDDAIIVHTNGHKKQWDMNDEITRQHWQPFL